MNYVLILNHKVFQVTGYFWRPSFGDCPHYSLSSTDGIPEITRWSVPGWPETEITPAQTHVDPDTGATIIDVPAVMGQVPPDISKFTQADEDLAVAAWSAHVQGSKSIARKTAENTLIKFCDTISGTTDHKALSPTAAYAKYKAACDAGQVAAANPKIIAYLLACVNIIAADMDVQYHPEIET